MLSEMWLSHGITPAAAWSLIGIAILLHLSLLIILRLSRRHVHRLPRRPVPNIFGDELSDLLFCDELSELPFGDELELHKFPKLPFSNELQKLLLPKEPSKAHKNQDKKTKKRGKKARHRKKGCEFFYATVHVPPKDHKKLSLVPAGLSRPDIHGMIDYEMKVLEFLEHGTTSVLGISGKRGMGKSTLLGLVYTSSNRYDSSFNYVFFAEAGIGFTASMLRDILAANIGLGSMPAVPAANVNLLSNFLCGESFVLLLDDLRASFDLAAAGLPMPLGPRQKVVFTTRNDSICAEMGSAGNNIRVECLAKDVAWDLFRYNIGAKIIDSDPEIEDLAKEMVAECRGIPSALCTIGRSMAAWTDVRQWRVAYEMLKIKRPPLHEIEEMDDEGYPRLDFFEDELGDPFLCTYLMSER